MSDKLKCPWCQRSDLPLHLLKRHVKFCEKAPQPRGRREAKPRTADELFGLPVEEKGKLTAP
jgi:hypothetical protein